MAAKVLVVEDNPDVMFVLLSAVDSQKCEFVGVEEGTSVLAMAKAERPDLIIMDVQLPGMTGLEACRLIRATPELRDTRILGISGHVPESDVEPSLFDAFIEKPFDVGRLVNEMGRLLEWDIANRQNASTDTVLPDQDADEPAKLTWDDGNGR